MQIAIAVLNSLGLGGLALFIYSTFKSLRTEVKALQATIEEQNRTLQAARERAVELEHFNQLYKQVLSDFQEARAMIDGLREETVKELEDALARRDEELAELKKQEVRRVETAQEGLQRTQESLEKMRGGVMAVRSSRPFRWRPLRTRDD